jgi:hypothetical protein
LQSPVAALFATELQLHHCFHSTINEDFDVRVKFPPRAVLLWVCLLLLAVVAWAGDRPYFITYDHTMEEPGNLEIEASGLSGQPQGGDLFTSGLMEFEYGAKGWWTTEFYLDGQTTANQSTLFTGYRWENRFRMLMKEHAINPLFYIEFEDINGADKVLKEIVGFDGQEGGLEPNSIAREEKKRELEMNLILSSNVGGWNIAENFITEKNLAGEPWEFGYAAAVSRPLSYLASANECVLCRENFQTGVEFYGGLGTANKFTVHGTSQYVAPLLSWQVHDAVFKVSPTFGLTDASYRVMLRFGATYEFNGFGRKVRNLFH